ncbi:unnamed protein product [Lactuca saligna]|uniref:Uncharacterized protein n=1 Tax=Lactuca saligna TaxID=75948 RepID=A0AA36E2D3_LACSI|nr:unnamed protein product [Lactuca saligna]
MNAYDIDYDLIFGILDRVIDAENHADDNHIPEASRHSDDSTFIREEEDTNSTSTLRVNVERVSISIDDQVEGRHYIILIKIQMLRGIIPHVGNRIEEKTKIYWWENENKAATRENNGRILQQVLSFYINNNTTTTTTTTTNGILFITIPLPIIIINPFFTHYYLYLLHHQPHLAFIILTHSLRISLQVPSVRSNSNMFGGHSGYPTFPEEHRSHTQFDMTALPQLQLFGKFPVGCTLDNINFVGNDHATAAASGRGIKRAREQKLHISLNNNFFCQDDAGLMNPNHNHNHPVSTGLKLSYEEDERNSSVTSISENFKALQPLSHSLTGNIKLEMDRQKQLLNHYLKLQEENMVKGIRELNEKHTVSLLKTLEKEVSKKLSEKEIEIENMNRKNMELGLKIKQASMEAQSWHYRAKYNESVVNALKNNLQQVMMTQSQKPVQWKEGYGDSEVDDAASYTNVNLKCDDMKAFNCRACKGREVMRTESLHVFMS